MQSHPRVVLPMRVRCARQAAEETVYVVCRDLSTMIKVIGKTSHFYAQAEAFSAYLHESLELVKNLVAVLKYTEQHRLYDVSALFVSIQAEVSPPSPPGSVHMLSTHCRASFPLSGLVFAG